MKTIKCIFCGHTERVQFTCQIPYSSKFNKVKSKPQKIEFGKCNCCEVPRITTSSLYSFLGSLHENIKYREPDFHLKVSSLRLVEHLHTPESTIIYRASAKDDSLANMLSQYKGTNISIEPQYLFDFNQSSINVEFKDNDIVLLNRIVEHINSFDLLSELVDKMKQSNVLGYIEILDFKSLYLKGDYSFLWDERLYYPTPEYLSAWLENNGFNIVEQFNYHQEGVDPFTCFLFTRIKGSGIMAKSTNLKHLNSNLFELTDLLVSINERIRYLLRYVESLAVYGIGHKSLFFCWAVKHIYPEIEITLFDGSSEKVGSYWDDLAVLDIKNANYKHNLHVFAFENKLTVMLSGEIVKSNANAKIIMLTSVFNFEPK